MTAPDAREPAASSGSVDTGAGRAAPTPLAPGRRLLAALLAWALIFAGTPGVWFDTGSALLGAAALVPWALACSRPGRFAFAIEWLAAAAGLGALMWWTVYVWAPAPVVIGLGQGVYMAFAGVVLRRLARRWPLALAAPAAWIALETLRTVIPTPFALGWQVLGHHLNATPWMVESARLWGLFGLGWVLAAPAGLAADFLLARGAPPHQGRARPGRLALGVGLLPPLVALGYGLSTEPPPSVPGPSLLLVQPAFEQARKQSFGTPEELFLESWKLTRDALAEEAAAGHSAPDLVVWGETMLYALLYEPEVRGALLDGAQAPPWRPPLSLEVLDDLDWRESDWVAGWLFGLGRQRGILPPGTSFLSGTQVIVEHAGELRRTNSVALYTEGGVERQTAAKTRLVPGAETMVGLERLSVVRDVIQDLADYVPDFVPGERGAVFRLPWTPRPGDAAAASDAGEPAAARELRMGATVCFDNAYEDPYTAALAAEPLDFHLVVSNEAWYLDSCEMDQMLAFSRVLAAATGRAMVRAGNSGVTLVIGADGRDLERLEVDGRDRHVPGHLLTRVPIPADGLEAAVPLYVRTRHGWLGLFLLLPVALGAFRRTGRRSGAPPAA